MGFDTASRKPAHRPTHRARYADRLFGARKPRTGEHGRICAEPDCETILSIYNRSSLCSLHGPMSHEAAMGYVRIGRRYGESVPQAKLTWADIDEIRARWASGSTQNQLAQVFGVAQQTICAIVNHRRWKESTRWRSEGREGVA